jgi:hypothetical protein
MSSVFQRNLHLNKALRLRYRKKMTPEEMDIILKTEMNVKKERKFLMIGIFQRETSAR